MGVALSVLASLVGGYSKLLLRKSWNITKDEKQARMDLLQHNKTNTEEEEGGGEEGGKQLDSKAAIARQDSTLKKQASRGLRLRFIGLLGMTIINPALGIIAMAFANPSILAPFSGLTLVWIVVGSKRMTGEKPNRKQIVAAAFIVLGEIVIALSGDHTGK
jgi:hypothetical protein